MGWFDEQVRQRKRIDEELYQNSFDTIAHKVLGERLKKQDDRTLLKSAIDSVFYYYHYPKIEIPYSIKEPLEQIEYAASSVGMMKANIKLKDGWYTDCFGPIICFFKDSGLPIALFPMGFAKYYFIHPDTGKKMVLGKKTADMFSEDAVAFYEPLPLKKLGIPDLLAYMKKRITYSDWIYLIIVMMIGVGVSMVLPFATEKLTGEVLESKSFTLFVSMSMALVISIFFGWYFDALKQAVQQRIKWKVSIPVQQAVMQRILTLPVPFFRQYSAGELQSRASSIDSICDILIEQAFCGSLSALISLIYVTQISNFAPQLVVPALVVIGLTLAYTIFSTIMQMGITRSRMELMAKENGLCYAIINGIQKIKLAGAEKRAFAKWADEFAESAALAYNPPFFLKINTAISTGIALLGTVVFYGISIESGISTSEYFAFNIAYNTLLMTFTTLASASLSIAMIKPVLDMAEPILKAEPEKTLKKDIATRVSGSIEMNGIRFRYSEQDPYILDNFNLKIRAGEYVAVVGKTGCGKSTLVRLLLGFEKPEKGVVFYDGKDIERIDLKSLRRKIGSVIQDGKLFYGDIFHNIAIASEKLSEEEAWEAAEIAGIADDIRAMPMGMHTIISEGQGGISGGQRQRLLIARAIAPKPKILIFDEATSALDNITQKQISKSLDELKCTRIVIAHRLSTIKNCDRILVLDGGKIIEQGKYEELIDKKGFFYELVKRQQL